MDISSKTKKSIQLGISEFAVPSPRTGHIEMYSGYGGLPNLGAAIHYEIQAQRMTALPGYVPERWISHTFGFQKHRVTVNGRMDGFVFGAPVRIEEIKTAYNPEELLASLNTHPHHPYRLQLRTYGYLQWLSSNSLPQLFLHIVNTRTRKGVDLEVDLDIPDYEAWLNRRLAELIEEENKFESLARKRIKVAQVFPFPFEQPRPGQKELIETVAKGISTSGGRMLLQAPTGLGKTAGVLYPSLRESMERGQKTLYLTAKNSQHEVAEDAVRRMQEVGVKIRSVTIHAKGKMCLKEEPHCNPQYCEYARDHYTKVSENELAEKLGKKKRLGIKTFHKMAEQYQVCPFELQFEAVPSADVVVCDYNYVFSPRNSINRFTHNGYSPSANKSRPNLIVDEIHNLPGRSAEHFSASLSCEEVRNLTVDTPDEVRTQAVAVLEWLRAFCADLSGGERLTQPRQVTVSRERFSAIHSASQELMAHYLAANLPLRTQDPVLRTCNLVSEFAQALEFINDDFFVTLTPSPSGGILKVTCCSTVDWLKECYDHFANVVGFSATLKPFDYYSRLLGLDSPKLTTAEFSSPFPAERRKILLIPQISTKMRDRESNFSKIKDVIERVLSLQPGNYFVFFPSFDFMNKVFRMVELPGFRLICQQREMRREAVAECLDKLRENIPTVIFAVQGGVFAEGVDYPGSMLIGAVIVGPALPTFDFERELLRQYYDHKHGNGFDYAYTYPAMARVVQSAGRVIRSPTDRGLIVLLDRRFTLESYQKSMPEDWLKSDSLVSKQIIGDVTRFWENCEN